MLWRRGDGGICLLLYFFTRECEIVADGEGFRGRGWALLRFWRWDCLIMQLGLD